MATIIVIIIFFVFATIFLSFGFTIFLIVKVLARQDDVHRVVGEHLRPVRQALFVERRCVLVVEDRYLMVKKQVSQAGIVVRHGG